jgi:hypothetical protein
MTVPLFYDRENPKKQVALTAIALRATAQRESISVDLRHVKSDAEKVLSSERGDFLDLEPMPHHIATGQPTNLAFSPPYRAYSRLI